MKKLALTGSLLLLLEVSSTGVLHAARTKHRPWLSGGNKSKPEAVQVVQKESSKKVPAVRVTRNSVTNSNHPGQKIVQQAMMYQGTRYRFGGTSKAKGFDCSGLVARVWADLKLKKVPRASAALYKAGTPVRLADLREGDLVFFKNT